MTAEPPTEKFVMIQHVVLDYGLSPQAFTLYAGLLRHADWTTGHALPSRETLAGYLGNKQHRTVDKFVKELQDHGLVLDVMHRWRNPENHLDVVFHKDDQHTAQTSNLYVVNLNPAASQQVKGGCTKVHGGGARKCTRTRTP